MLVLLCMTSDSSRHLSERLGTGSMSQTGMGALPANVGERALGLRRRNLMCNSHSRCPVGYCRVGAGTAFLRRKQAAQSGTAPRQPRLHCAQIDAQDVGDLLVGKAFNFAQHDNGAEGLWNKPQGRFHPVRGPLPAPGNRKGSSRHLRAWHRETALRFRCRLRSASSMALRWRSPAAYAATTSAAGSTLRAARCDRATSLGWNRHGSCECCGRL